MIILRSLLVLAMAAAIRLAKGPECPRVAMGYHCHSYLPSGCEYAGRGCPSAPKQFNNFNGEK